MSERNCPKCVSKPLSERRLSDKMTRIDICSECRGGWFDATELARVLSTAVEGLEIPEQAEVADRNCPKCRIALLKFMYPETDIEVDACGRCWGVWLDRGEFRGINESRARYQDKTKMSDREIEMLPEPTTFREAVISFVDRIMIRWDIGEA